MCYRYINIIIIILNPSITSTLYIYINTNFRTNKISSIYVLVYFYTQPNLIINV